MLKEGYTLRFQSGPSLTRSPNYQLLCISSQEPILVRGITSVLGQRCSRASSKSLCSSWFQNTQPLETYSWSGQIKPFGDHQDHPPTMGVGYLNSFHGRLLPYTNTGTVQEISEISCPRADIPVQSTVFRSVHCTHGAHCKSKGIETDVHIQGCKNPQYLDDWLVKTTSQRVCLQHTQDLVKICQELGWLVNLENRNWSRPSTR